MSLAHDKAGEIRLGRDYSPSHWNSVFFDPLGGNGIGKIGNFSSVTAGNGTGPTSVFVSNSISCVLPSNIGRSMATYSLAGGEI